MKNSCLVLTISFLIFFLYPSISNAQWLNRYGVDSVNQLSEEQVDLAMTRANKNLKVGRTAAIIGGAAVVLGGVNITRGYNYKGDEFLGGLGLAVGGMATVGVGVVVGVAGLFTYRNNDQMLQEIIKIHGIRRRIVISPLYLQGINNDYIGLSLNIKI